MNKEVIAELIVCLCVTIIICFLIYNIRVSVNNTNNLKYKAIQSIVEDKNSDDEHKYLQIRTMLGYFVR